ncbi:YbaB/EbfC family nucleoid-associated protein [Candidatus Acetothermia bacterium]|jgi:hypothetical protein|nr:YbaB/EbfC family nucleoid-associated protein [Candidatus Acetothermia bacterium]MBI3642585.1 YbaB/EbfC family nucleoid-associated protein [Candidatus Acetothermia bacterium]
MQFPGKMGDMIRQVKKAQEMVQKQQEELGKLRIEASSGGGMVKVVANGREEILEIIIQKEVVDPNDVEMLQDLIVAAVKEAQVKAKEESQKVMGDLMGSLGLPNIPGLI